MTDDESGLWLDLVQRAADDIRSAATLAKSGKDTAAARRALAFLKEEASDSGRSRIRYCASKCKSSKKLARLLKEANGILSEFKAGVASLRKGALSDLPIETLDQQKCFLYELCEAVLGTESLNVHTRKDAMNWILGQHADGDPFGRECHMALKIKSGGKKEKSFSTMLDYANHGKPGTATIKGSRSRSKVSKTLIQRRRDWEDAGKDDPNAVNDSWR